MKKTTNSIPYPCNRAHCGKRYLYYTLENIQGDYLKILTLRTEHEGSSVTFELFDRGFDPDFQHWQATLLPVTNPFILWDDYSDPVPVDFLNEVLAEIYQYDYEADTLTGIIEMLADDYVTYYASEILGIW